MTESTRGNSGENHAAALTRVSESQRRADLVNHILRTAGTVGSYHDGSVQATRIARDYAKRIATDAAELVSSLEDRYEAIKDAPYGGQEQ